MMKKIILITSILLTTVIIAQSEGLRTLIYPPFKHCWGIYKGTESRLKMLLGRSASFDNPQGLAVTRLKRTDNPKDPRDDDELSAYGVNSGLDQIIYNVSMYKLATYGTSGSGKDNLNAPRGISADPDGHVFVCDTGNRRIVRLEHTRKGLQWVSAFGEEILIEPHDVSVTESGTLFVTDHERGTIDIFTYEGLHIRTLTGLVKPRGIGIDNPALTRTRYGDRVIFVVDSDGTQLRKLDYNGRVIATANAYDLVDGNGTFSYLALDFYNNAWVTDSVNCLIHKFDNNLEYVVSVGECGDGDYQFEHPTGIAIWRRFGQVVVAERRSAQYYWIGSDVAGFEIYMGEDRDGNRSAVIDIDLTDHGYVSITIKRDGNTVREFLSHSRFRQGSRTVRWDLKDDDGNPVPPGEYEFELYLEPTYSSYGHFYKTVVKKAVIDA